MRKINWTCPRCGHTDIVMITKRATVITPIIGMHDDVEEPVFDYSRDEIEDGENSSAPISYECGVCGNVIAQGRDGDFIKKVKRFITPKDMPPNARVVYVKENNA